LARHARAGNIRHTSLSDPFRKLRVAVSPTWVFRGSVSQGVLYWNVMYYLPNGVPDDSRKIPPRHSQ
ncbi:MAG TPA: hypothetical protein PK261_06750, partial [Accumulibacter sp.]|nr:hypothetical protein [Accumulibacter sp.]